MQTSIPLRFTHKPGRLGAGKQAFNGFVVHSTTDWGDNLGHGMFV